MSRAGLDEVTLVLHVFDCSAVGFVMFRVFVLQLPPYTQGLVLSQGFAQVRGLLHLLDRHVAPLKPLPLIRAQVVRQVGNRIPFAFLGHGFCLAAL